MRRISQFIITLATVGTLLTGTSAAAGSPAELVLGDAERRQATEGPRSVGPFHPVVGKVDYGSFDAGFGAARSGHMHAGQDVFAPAGRPLVAVAEGIVVEVGADGGRGNYLALFDPQRNRTYVYFHMVEPATVSQGARVSAGERLGGVGCTGSCWGDHLHFEVHTGRGAYGEAVDPLALLHDWRALERPR